MNEKDIYKGIPLDKIPWKRETPPDILINTIKSLVSSPSHLLDLGCGLGHYAAYFAQNGYKVSGIDISQIAVSHANQLFGIKNLKGDFYELDLCKTTNITLPPIELAYEFEVLHHIYPEYRKMYVQNVRKLLSEGGYYLSICFSKKDQNFGGEGKYRKTPIGTELYFSSVEEIQDLMSQYFRILEIKEVELEGKTIPHQAIFCLMQKSKF
ncbi:class I SAM-dependent methyltransferase [Marinifilum sp. D714]|uniref:class I SAM-dependent methyltransferase n=1 Tax=Marinifilum sp. D714 TaxID=2937523 RepID=UPI0027CD7EB8|nr:class I SAM-dependent methyltransferase [Marinifilum sp. D714]MDQ2177766.1 class I SAM-dependent methyltransferase [Marinifilum sp. D714]